MPDLSLSTDEVRDDVLGVLSSWLPGYDDRNPQNRISLVSEDEAGEQIYRYERPYADPCQGGPSRYRVVVRVEEIPE